MNNVEIVEAVRKELNSRGGDWGLHFEVSPTALPEGSWLQVFVKSDARKDNAAAERQIISDVEADLSDSSGTELLIVPVSELHVA